MKKHQSKNNFRFLFWLILSTLLFPPNLLGLAYKISSEDERKISFPIIFKDNQGNASTLEPMEELKLQRSPAHEISWVIILMITLLLMIAPYLGILGIRNLEDQPLNKQSVLNKLCRDCARIIIVYVVAWSMYIMTAYFIKDSEHLTLYLRLTMLMAYVNEALYLLGMLYLFVIGSLRLYTIVYQVLDPLGDWFGEDEDSVMMLIRLSTSALVGFFIGIMYLTSSIPVIFYKLSESDFNWGDVPLISRLKLGFNVACCVIPVMLFAAGKLIQDKKDAALKKESALNIAKTSDEKSGKEFTYYVSLVSTLYLGSGLVILALVLMVYLDVIHVNIWWILIALMGSQGVGIPIIFLTLNQPFRTYCLRQVRYDLSNGFGWINSWISIAFKQSPRVSPLQ